MIISQHLNVRVTSGSLRLAMQVIGDPVWSQGYTGGRDPPPLQNVGEKLSCGNIG